MFKHSIAALALMAMPAFAEDAGLVVAEIGDQEITLGQMLVLKESLPAEMAGLDDQTLWDMLLDQLVRQAAMAATLEGKLSQRDEASLAVQRRAYLAGAALERIAEPMPSDDEILAAYEREYGSDGIQTEYHAAHILLETPEAAKAAIEAIEAGEDFGKVAQERSVGPSGPNKGDLGWFPADRMVAPFAEAVQAMEPGEVSAEPVETEFGFHVIKLMETRKTEPPKLEEVRDDLITLIRRERVETAIDEATAATKVERKPDLDAALLSDLSPLEAR